MVGITIVGTGRYLPAQIVKNDELSRVMDTGDDWIRPRSGIAQRHYAAEGEGVSDMGKEAALRALEAANLTPSDVDYIIFATMTPEYAFPGPGAMMGSKLGISGVPALDIRQQCAAIPFALQVAQGLIQSGAARTILLVGAEAHAGFMPWPWDVIDGSRNPTEEEYEFATKHRGTTVLFGDGAGAMVLRASEGDGRGFMGAVTKSDGKAYDYIYVKGGMFSKRRYWESDEHSKIPSMRGPELFKSAVTLLPRAVREVCEKTNTDINTIDWFLAHQANDRINDAVRQALKVEKEKVPSNILNYGNTSAATIPILVDEMMRDGRLQKGQLVCFLALGAGLNWGAALMRL